MLKYFTRLGTIGALWVVAACSGDRTVGMAPESEPQAQLAPAPAPSIVAAEAVVAERTETPAPGQHGILAAAYPSNAVTYQFWYDPRYDGSYYIGDHLMWFPFNTVCDPALSSYGPSTWLYSCTKATKPILITATTWRDAMGRPQIDFSNALRFYRNSWNELPAIYLMDPYAVSMGRIDYCVTGGACVNEAATDPALVTQRDSYYGWLFRLVRHFSGYNVWA